MSNAGQNLFEQIPDNLFGPLASLNRRLNWLVLLRLYQELFDEIIETGEFGHARTRVIRVIENVLAERADLWIEDEFPDDETPSGSENVRRTRATHVYYALSKSGWLEVERRGFHDYVNMSHVVNQCLGFLIELAEGRPLVVTGKLKTLEAGMRQVLSDPSGQADTLVELVKEAIRFSRQVNSIKGAIKGLYDQIRGNLPPREIVARFFDDFLAEIFVRDYAALKTSENPILIRDELLRIITTLNRKPELHSQLVAGYQRLYSHQDSDLAPLRLEKDLSRLEQVFLNIPRQLDAIDDMKIRYEQRIDMVIDYATRVPRTLGKDLKRLTQALTRLSTKDAPEIRLPLMMPEAPSESRLFKPRCSRKAPTPRAVKKTPISDDVRKRTEWERAARRQVQVNEEALISFLDNRLQYNRTANIAFLQVHTLRDYFCVLELRRMARIPHVANQQFPILLEQYNLTLTPDWIETPYFRIQDVVITRRGQL